MAVTDNWGSTLKEAVQKEELKVMPYELKLDYNYWTYRMKTDLLCEVPDH